MTSSTINNGTYAPLSGRSERLTSVFPSASAILMYSSTFFCREASANGPRKFSGFSAGPIRRDCAANARRWNKSVAVDGVEHDHARAGRALRPLKTEGRIHDLRHGFVKVGIVVHDGGVLAAHFRDDPLDLPLARLHLGRLFHDVQAHVHRTGKADEADVRVFHQIVAHD